jgi:hypothetical protein
MQAEVTYNNGVSYRIKKFVFKRGITQTISDSEVIEHLSNTVGFAVRILEREKKVVRKAITPPAQPVKQPPVVKSSIPTGAEEAALTIESKKIVKEPTGSVTGKKKRRV